MEAAFTFSEGIWVSAGIDLHLVHQASLDAIPGWNKEGGCLPQGE